jgi:UDP-N-acetylglucosamine diphosphorylase / glucose-1-phosphate thymidylyltransferase / UDP-N-acetylgalactosamine diphosphorylase / glucosamine-1-phosphate N-acetyltransferase / galactosamine-1-phosphate N-acetyltransferase
MGKIKKYSILSIEDIPPFNQPASELNVLNKPLKLAQRDALAPYCEEGPALESLMDMPTTKEETIIYRDNLYFDAPYIEAFIKGQPCRAAFRPDDQALLTYTLPLSRNVTTIHKRSDHTGYGNRAEVDYYAFDLWYFPRGYAPDLPATPLFIESGSEEVGYYSVPDYMSNRGDLGHFVTKRSIISIEHWIHLFFANVPMGIFSIGHRFEYKQKTSNLFLLKILWRALVEQTQLLSCSELVYVGRNCTINPTAIIQGPTFIGDNCTIGAGAVIQNSYIGNNVNIDQGAQLMLSVVGDGCFLPFRASLYLTVLMEHCIIAQNTCLQMCVVGRGSFIGAGSTFTDYNLLPKPLEAEALDGKREKVGQPVLGSCVGHNCRVGSGMVVYPGRMIESDVVLFAKPDRRILRKNIAFEESDHHDLRPEISRLHKQKFPRRAENVGEEAMLEDW